MRARSYEIRIRGSVPDRVVSQMLQDFPAIELATVLLGTVRDQSELQALLRRLYDLGIEVVAFRQVPPAAPETPREAPIPPARTGG